MISKLKSMKPIVKLVIYKERLVGYIHPDRPNYVGVLKPSILKGDSGSWDSRLIVNPSDVRLATSKDAETFNFDFSQYDNDPIYNFEYLK